MSANDVQETLVEERKRQWFVVPPSHPRTDQESSERGLNRKLAEIDSQDEGLTVARIAGVVQDYHLDYWGIGGVALFAFLGGSLWLAGTFLGLIMLATLAVSAYSRGQQKHEAKNASPQHLLSLLDKEYFRDIEQLQESLASDNQNALAVERAEKKLQEFLESDPKLKAKYKNVFLTRNQGTGKLELVMNRVEKKEDADKKSPVVSVLWAAFAFCVIVCLKYWIGWAASSIIAGKLGAITESPYLILSVGVFAWAFASGLAYLSQKWFNFSLSPKASPSEGKAHLEFARELLFQPLTDALAERFPTLAKWFVKYAPLNYIKVGIDAIQHSVYKVFVQASAFPFLLLRLMATKNRIYKYSIGLVFYLSALIAVPFHEGLKRLEEILKEVEHPVGKFFAFVAMSLLQIVRLPFWLLTLPGTPYASFNTCQAWLQKKSGYVPLPREESLDENDLAAQEYKTLTQKQREEMNADTSSLIRRLAWWAKKEKTIGQNTKAENSAVDQGGSPPFVAVDGSVVDTDASERFDQLIQNYYPSLRADRWKAARVFVSVTRGWFLVHSILLFAGWYVTDLIVTHFAYAEKWSWLWPDGGSTVTLPAVTGAVFLVISVAYALVKGWQTWKKIKENAEKVAGLSIEEKNKIVQVFEMEKAKNGVVDPQYLDSMGNRINPFAQQHAPQNKARLMTMTYAFVFSIGFFFPGLLFLPQGHIFGIDYTFFGAGLAFLPIVATGLHALFCYAKDKDKAQLRIRGSAFLQGLLFTLFMVGAAILIILYMPPSLSAKGPSIAFFSLFMTFGAMVFGGLAVAKWKKSPDMKYYKKALMWAVPLAMSLQSGILIVRMFFGETSPAMWLPFSIFGIGAVDVSYPIFMVLLAVVGLVWLSITSFDKNNDQTEKLLIDVVDNCHEYAYSMQEKYGLGHPQLAAKLANEEGQGGPDGQPAVASDEGHENGARKAIEFCFQATPFPGTRHAVRVAEAEAPVAGAVAA